MKKYEATGPEKGVHTQCTHTGEVPDPIYQGAVSPIYTSTSYAYDQVDLLRYPRYFNTPNQEGVSRKIAALEKAESAMVFSSGMAAISTVLMTFLQKGDHVLLPRSLYGGTYHLAKTQLPRQGITFDFVDTTLQESVRAAVRPNTRVVFLESPSNPTLEVTDLDSISGIARERGLLTVIDNTFASPINQNPIEWGIDLVVHSGTKYLGGHSDLSSGAVAGSNDLMEEVWNTAICYGGNLGDYAAWMLERSLKTLKLRVDRQVDNAGRLSRYLEALSWVKRVYYPGLDSFPQHELARKQMKAFGAMLSFELEEGLQAEAFLRSLKLIKPSMSLAGLESTVLLPARTSHSLMPASEREKLGISDRLIRFSVGIEDFEDLVADLEGAHARTIEIKQ